MHKASIIAILGLAALLAACGQGDSAPKTSAATPTPAAAPAEPATTTMAPIVAEPIAGTPTPPPPGVANTTSVASTGDQGKSVFDRTCALCHAPGIAGAPMFGNKEQWAARIAKGKDTLYQHAMQGFTGEAGMMPPRGGNSALSDDEIKAAVDYMIGKSS